MNLHTAGHRRGVVAAPHHAAAEAGREILADGGNAIEAMVAMAASIAAVYPHMNHIGGDGFWLIREPRGRVRAIEACGPAGALARRELYRDYETIPARGPLAALTVPGAIGGWAMATEAARAFGGKTPLDVLLGSAIRACREGYTVTRSQARLTREKFDELKDAPGFAAAFLIPPLKKGRSVREANRVGIGPPPQPSPLQGEGERLSGEGLHVVQGEGEGERIPPEEGATLHQLALGATLDQLANAGLDDFYRGDVAREIAVDLDRIGSPVTRADLESFQAKLRDPLQVSIEAGTLYNTPPPTQGLASLMILALFDRLRVKEAEGFDHVHGLVEATKRAFRIRDRAVTDYDRLDGPPKRFLDDAFLDAEAALIDRRRAARWPAPFGEGDTIWMGAADASGIVVSYIQSIYWEWGSGCVLPHTGVLMQNRGASFSLDPDALNPLQPGRRPFHTLNPAMALLDDGRAMAYGTMGGDGQPQSQAAVFTRHVTFRQPLDEALDRPRWLLGRTWGSDVTNLRLESRFPDALVDRLLSAGHEVDVLPEAYSDTMGHAGAVILHPNGTLEGGHDPRADGGAAGV